MKVEDRVYGEVGISESVLLEIINSPALQRLKDIDQAGYFEPYFPGTRHSRFEHSVGVCSLLKKYGAPIEEQIAGLIHDVSHSAFSHCIDYVLDVGSEKEHNHQDNVFDDYVKRSEIPAILKKYKFNLDYILDDKNFPLEERDLPDLCADRIDYSLRTARVLGEIENANYFLNNLVAENGNWIFKSFESAKKYAELFLKLNTNYYAGLPSALMFRTVGDYLRYALSKKYISETDLYTTDRVVLSKIEPHHKSDKQLKLLFDRASNKIGFKNDPHNFDSEVFCKSRIVDPLCRDQQRIKRVSEIDAVWKEVVKTELKPKHYFLKFDR
ncbi:MAG: HD domain-containing protein [bacterium]|nr:HD domain-containing protein [bacterium]